MLIRFSFSYGLIITFSVLNYSCFFCFKFVEFPYKETKKNEIIFREFETACQQSSVCSLKKDIENLQCIRECISPACYAAIYKHDELEKGEIDVRLNSFKGCFVQRTKNRA